MRQREPVHGRIILIGTAQERNVSIHICRKTLHPSLPRLAPVRIRATPELHMQEHPVLEDDAERIGAPIQILRFLSHIDGRAGSLDGIATLIQHRIQRLDEDGDFTLVVEIGELLQTDRVLILDPRFDGRTAVIVSGITGVYIPVLKRQYDTCNSTSVDAEVRDVNLEDIHTLICGIRRIVAEFGIQNYIVRGLIILELDSPRTKVISRRVEHSRISKGFRGRRPP